MVVFGKTIEGYPPVSDSCIGTWNVESFWWINKFLCTWTAFKGRSKCTTLQTGQMAGASSSDWSQISAFYSYWGAFSTAKTFAWADKYNPASAPNRKVSPHSRWHSLESCPASCQIDCKSDKLYAKALTRKPQLCCLPLGAESRKQNLTPISDNCFMLLDMLRLTNVLWADSPTHGGGEQKAEENKAKGIQWDCQRASGFCEEERQESCSSSGSKTALVKFLSTSNQITCQHSHRNLFTRSSHMTCIE